MTDLNLRTIIRETLGARWFWAPILFFLSCLAFMGLIIPLGPVPAAAIAYCWVWALMFKEMWRERRLRKALLFRSEVWETPNKEFLEALEWVERNLKKDKPF